VISRSAVEAENRSAVGVQVANGLKPVGKGFGAFQSGKKNYIMYLPDLSVFFIDGADFAGDHEAGLAAASPDIVLPAKAVFEGIESLLGRDKLFPELLPPGRMGEVACSDQVEALAPRPQLQHFGNAILAGGPGIF